MEPNTRQTYRYELDAGDVIRAVDHWWLAFASENGAAHLNEATVVGRPLWDFISDDPTQQLYRELHERVRTMGHAIDVPFRCDSPTLRREMQLTIHRGENGVLLYESKLLKTAVQQRLPQLSHSRERSNAFLTMCSCCKRSLLEPKGWLEMEEIALRLRLYDQPSVPGLRYTVCPRCVKRYRKNRDRAEVKTQA
jgi:hypothetical protein